MADDQMARDVANLRLQLNELQRNTHEASLPNELTRARLTLKWASVIIAGALLVSSMIRGCNDTEIRELRRRIERLEHASQ